MPANSGRHTILLVEDQTLVRRSLTSLINSSEAFQVTHSAETVTDAIDLLQKYSFALLLCDFHLRNETAVDLLRWLNGNRREPLQPPVVLLSSFFNAIEIQRTIALGAKGFLFKESDFDELLQALQIVIEGGLHFSLPNLPEGNPAVRVQYHRHDNRITHAKNNATGTLTPSEQEILKWLATGMSNKQIALTLGKSSETVKIQVSNLLKKLDTRTRTQAVVKAHRLNLL